MATDAPSTFINNLLPHIRNWEITDASKIEMLNRANDEFAAMAPWRWLCIPEAAIALAGDQEVSWTPSSTHIEVPLVYYESEGSFKILTPAGMVPTTAETEGLPSIFTVTGTSGDYKIKLFPKPPTGLDANILPIMKKEHTRITSGNWNTTSIFEWPDAYSHIFNTLLLDKLYLYSQSNSMSSFAVERNVSRVTNMYAKAEILAQRIMPFASMFYSESGQ